MIIDANNKRQWGDGIGKGCTSSSGERSIPSTIRMLCEA